LWSHAECGVFLPLYALLLGGLVVVSPPPPPSLKSLGHDLQLSELVPKTDDPMNDMFREFVPKVVATGVLKNTTNVIFCVQH